MSCVLRVLVALLFLAGAGGARAGTLVQFRTTLGDVVVMLYDEDKPLTVRNFLRYVDAGRYTNNIFHRCVPGFVVQGGGYGVTTPASTNAFLSAITVPKYNAITNEFAAGPRCSNVYGTIAMAKTGANPDSATSEWFFNLADNSANLDYQNGGFTVFGHVIRGTNVLEQFNALAPWDGLVNLGNEVFSSVPVTYSGMIWPQYNQLIYVDIEVLKTDVAPSVNGGCEVRWNSVAGMTNIVECMSAAAPFGWSELMRTNGTGGPLCVRDEGGTSCMYRIRVE